tara:strand:- start:1459 stop:3261 length:1803 start_codon:yes stop_codon:yes gene_type:complete
MCGFIGGISKTPLSSSNFNQANSHIICRGPDKNLFFNNKNTVFTNSLDNYYHFEFNRLSILDLSESANQPMYSSTFDSLLMFNGEIYNHAELRDELKSNGVKFQTSHSDTEVILKGLSKFGMDFIEKLNGQFSIFFINNKSKKAYLARDRLGQKPLYFSLKNNTLLFSSNFISINELLTSSTINEESLNNYLNLGVIPGEKTLIDDISEVLPSQIVEVDIQNLQIKRKKIYWDISKLNTNFSFNNEEYFSLFDNAVKIRQNADVPVAYFLSGGIDSTSIVKSAQQTSGDKINTFSVIQGNSKYDESYWSDIAAQVFNTNHTKQLIDSNLNIESIQSALCSLDQPYFDPSVLPSFLLSKEISKHYKVAISGDGGDELLGGYERIIKSDSIKLRTNFSKLLFNIYPSIFGTGNKILRYSKKNVNAYWSFHEDLKLLNLLKMNPIFSYRNNYTNSKYNLSLKELMIADYKFFLSEMMLFKVDRTSMANSLEVRSPFLDHRLIEYVLGSNLSFIDSNNPKIIMKNYLKENFDEEFLNRKKQGFVFDVENWVFENINYIKSEMKNSIIINEFNKDIFNKLSLIKSRVNGIRIWKLFVLENFMKRL